MYMEDHTTPPGDRIGEEMLQRILTQMGDAGTPRPIKGEEQSRRSWGLENYPLASVYAPLQKFHKLHDRDTAWHRGTLFSELDLPFLGQSVMKGGAYHD